MKAWSDIPAAMIMNSLSKCGIANNLDGSEDDIVYDSTEDNINNSELDFDQLFQSDFKGCFAWKLFFCKAVLSFFAIGYQYISNLEVFVL